MSEWTRYLRLLVQSDKEAKVTKVDVTETPTQFTSQLVGGNTRKAIGVYNNSNENSGECFYGFSSYISPSGEAMVIPVGAHIGIPIANTSNIDLYFCASSGELGDLRVEEYA